jgi:ABC-type nitrate/sulfonate/bicarbonate transport system substrate-binding protein
VVKSVLVAVVMSALVVSCSSTAKPPAAASSHGAVSAARCAQNRAAGTVRYLTGYQFQASASILDVVAADGLGYYRDLCLNVDVKPGTGDTGVNARLVAAGTVAVSDVGSESDLLVARAHGVDVVGLATYGHVPIDTLMTMPSITSLSQLVGKTLGQKGILPPSIHAMLTKDGVDVAKIRQVKVGFDPSVLPRGQVQALAGYKSNEPLTLKARGTTVTEWNPEHYGIAGSFGTIIANPAFVAAHLSAVEDFLRATLHAYGYCESHAQQCVAMAAKRSPAGFDVAHNVAVWTTEDSLVRASLPAGLPLGSVDPTKTAAEAQVLVQTGQLPLRASIADAFVAAPLQSIYSGDTLVWPGR